MPEWGHLILRRLAFDTRAYRAREEAARLADDARSAMAEALRLHEFYKSGPKDRLMVPDPSDILRQMQGQKVLIYELETEPWRGSLEREIVAASILLDYELPVPDDTSFRMARFLRVGMQYCVLNGYSIQQLMNSVTLFDTLIHDPTGLYFGGIVEGNDVSLRNVLAMGYEAWPQSQVPRTLDCEVRHRAGTSRTGKNVQYFRAGINALTLAAENILDWRETSIRTRRTRGSAAPRPEPHDDILHLAFSPEPRFIEPILHYAQRAKEQRPRTLDELKAVFENDSISDNFIMWGSTAPDTGIARILPFPQALWRKLFGQTGSDHRGG